MKSTMLCKFRVYIISLILVSVQCAVKISDEIEEQGLYNSKADNVVILGQVNFNKKLYGQDHAWLVQFYNSFCGHCRAFAPKFKAFASDIAPWKPVIRLAVIDCFLEENNGICRDFEIMAYPSLRYIPEHFSKSNSELGDPITSISSVDMLRAELVTKIRSEQARNRLPQAPTLEINSYASYTSALADVPNDVVYTFLIFENENSTTGSEIILDTSDYAHIKVKRVHETSELAEVARVNNFPGLVVVRNTLERTLLTPKIPDRQALLRAINAFLKSNNYAFPVRENEHTNIPGDSDISKSEHEDKDNVYYSDLEKTLKTALHTEVTRYKIIEGETLDALLDFLNVVIGSFPFKGNGRDYIIDLRDTLSGRTKWAGSEVYDLVKQLELKHAPVYTSKLEYIGCKGSAPRYRGYTCGLWTLFHTLTANAAQLPGNEGPKVLRAMHGYVKHFFGCTECAEHFQAMAARNRIFEVKENDKAVLWLWISHNEVNLRLAGDMTEDPDHPKIQFPTAARCPECRLTRGAWNLPAVYRYLSNMYGSTGLRDEFNATRVTAAIRSVETDNN